MGQVLYEDTLAKNASKIHAADDKPFKEPNSVMGEDWDTQIEDFVDDFDDYQDVGLPNTDEDYY